MKRYEPGDQVEVDINSGVSGQPLWVPATVLLATNPRNGWTPARTLPNSQYPGISRGPGWAPEEIRPPQPPIPSTYQEGR